MGKDKQRNNNASKENQEAKKINPTITKPAALFFGTLDQLFSRKQLTILTGLIVFTALSTATLTLNEQGIFNAQEIETENLDADQATILNDLTVETGDIEAQSGDLYTDENIFIANNPVMQAASNREWVELFADDEIALYTNGQQQAIIDNQGNIAIPQGNINLQGGDLTNVDDILPENGQEVQITGNIDLAGNELSDVSNLMASNMQGDLLDLDDELRIDSDQSSANYYNHRFLGDPGSHLDYVVLLHQYSFSDDAGQNDITMGNFMIERGQSSAHGVHDMIRINAGGSRIEDRHFHSIKAQRTNDRGVGYDLTVVDYEGDTYVAMHYEAGRRHAGPSRGLYFAGMSTSSAEEHLEFVPYYDHDDDEILNEEIHDQDKEPMNRSEYQDGPPFVSMTDNLGIGMTRQPEAMLHANGTAQLEGNIIMNRNGSDRIQWDQQFENDPLHIQRSSTSSETAATFWGDEQGMSIGRDIPLSQGESLRVRGDTTLEDDLQVDGESQFIDDIDLSGNNLLGVGALSSSGNNIQMTDNVDMAGNNLNNVQNIDADGDKVDFNQYLTTNEGGGQHYVNKQVPNLCSGSDCSDRDYTEMWLLVPWSNEEVIGQIHGHRSTGNRGGRVIDIYYSSRSDISDSVTASLDVMEGWQSGSRSFDTWKLEKVEYEGEEWLALHADDSPVYASSEHFFSGYIRSGDTSRQFDVVDTGNPDTPNATIIEEVDTRSYRSLNHDQGVGINTNGFPSAELEVVGDIEASGDISGASKNFVQDINETHEVVYTSQESQDARAIIENSTELEEGEKLIEFPNHYSSVISEDKPGFNIQLTPKTTETYGLAYTKVNNTHMKVEELMNGENSVKFDYRISAIRDGYEDKEVLRQK